MGNPTADPAELEEPSLPEATSTPGATAETLPTAVPAVPPEGEETDETAEATPAPATESPPEAEAEQPPPPQPELEQPEPELPPPPGADCDTRSFPEQEACTIHEVLGVFASPLGDDRTGTGTRHRPYATLTKAITVARSARKRVYACADAGPFVEQLQSTSTSSGLQLFGGFRCEDFSYDPDLRATVQATAPIAWSFYLVQDMLLSNFEIIAADATQPGASSIAVSARFSKNLALRRVTVRAGKGAPGAEGASGVAGTNGAFVSPSQRGKPAVCRLFAEPSPRQLGGLWNGTSTCGSSGGRGGGALKDKVGEGGWTGVPGPRPYALDNGGALTPTPSAGGPGTAGAHAGDAPLPGAATGSGSFTSFGYQPVVTPSGMAAAAGQGGAGGGAGLSLSAGQLTCLGATGGAGGMGGCGGSGGKGGGGGGASIALFSWNSTLQLDEADLRSSQGGAGGQGGDGAPGGLGAAGGEGGTAQGLPELTIAPTAGGSGGPGGNGGASSGGSGGSGGPSLVIVFQGTAPELQNQGEMLTGVGGLGGAGGRSGALDALMSPAGPAGISTTTVDISAAL